MTFTPAAKPSNVKTTRQRGRVPKRVSSPYPMAKADAETRHQLDNHPPALAGGRVMFLDTGLWLPCPLEFGDPFLQPFQALGIWVVGHGHAFRNFAG
jgi:hypothetical protein